MWWLAAIFAIYFLFYFLPYCKELLRYNRMIDKLPVVPGSKFLIGHLGMLLYPQAQQFQEVRRITRENIHNNVFVLHIGFLKGVNVFWPEDVEAILSTTKHNKKALLYSFLIHWLGEGLLLSTGLKWQTRRKILTPAFHFSILQQFIEIFNKETDVLVNKLIKEVDKPYVDIKPLISELTLYSINETSMGSRLDSSTKEGREYIKSINEIGLCFYARFLSIWILFTNVIYHNLSPLGIKENKIVNILHKFTKNIIKTREETFEKFNVPDETDEQCYSTRKKLAFLDLMLNAKLKEGNIDDQGILDEVNTFMFEGHDTTAMNLIFTIILLACHKNHQDDVYEEIMQVIGNHQKPTYANLQELQFMERCIKESLRLYPSVPFIGRELSEDVDSTAGVIPRGAQTYVQIFDMHRNPRLWPDPDKFDPDRFLPENCATRHPFQYIPFSAGPRNCIGQRFAVLEIKAALVGILRKFKLEPIDRPETMEIMQDMVIRPFGEARVKFVLRDS